jgi:hypothetical protein
MWYHFVKLGETETTITYAFGYESMETTGRFEYNKVEGKATITKDFEGDTTYFAFDNAVHYLIEDYGAPDKKIIAFG